MLVVVVVELRDLVVFDADLDVSFEVAVAVLGPYETGLVSLVVGPLGRLVVAKLDLVVFDLIVVVFDGDLVVTELVALVKSLNENVFWLIIPLIVFDSVEDDVGTFDVLENKSPTW